MRVSVRTRYRMAEVEATVEPTENGEAKVAFAQQYARLRPVKPQCSIRTTR